MKKTFISTSQVARKVFNYVVPIVILVAFLLLIGYIYESTRDYKLIDIKVPVATDKSSYYPGQPIKGIFFGEVYHTGKTKILREVFCEDYRKEIEPLSNKEGIYYVTQSVPKKLEGTTGFIGNLPEDIPIGSNCVVRFINIYEINTMFGTREIDYHYYTQNFAIITKERRELLDCEAAGGTDCNQKYQQQVEETPKDSGVVYTPAPSYTTNNYDNSRSSTTQVTPAPSSAPMPSPTPSPSTQPQAQSPPVTVPKAQRCVIGLLNLCIISVKD